MARSQTKIGDIFSVKIDEKGKKHFQLIAFDLLQLNSDVIRAFRSTYPLNTTPDLTEVVKDEVEFYTHCVTKLGLKMNTWEKEGNIKDVGKLDHIIFRDTNDSGSRPGEQVQVSDKWYIWRIGDEKFTDVGRLEGENRQAEIGLVVNPLGIVHRIKTGKFHAFYPGFE